MKIIILALLLLSTVATADMRVNMICHIGDQEIANIRYTKNESAHFEYKTTCSLTDTLKRVLRCSVRFDDNITIHKLLQSSLLHTLTLGFAGHAALFEIAGAIADETYGYSVSISKGLLGASQVFTNAEKKVQWGEPARFYLNEDMYIEITAQQHFTKKRFIALSDSDISECSSCITKMVQRADKNSFTLFRS